MFLHRAPLDETSQPCVIGSLGSGLPRVMGNDIWKVTRAVRDSPEVLVCRLVAGKITLRGGAVVVGPAHAANGFIKKLPVFTEGEVDEQGVIENSDAEGNKDGTTILYEEDVAENNPPIGLGDFVSFTVAGTLATNIQPATLGPVCDLTINVDASGNQTVPEGQTLCVTNGATLTGNIKTDGGNIVVIEASTVTGIIRANRGDLGTLPSITIEGDSIAGGNVKIDEGSKLTVTSSTVLGKVKADETQEVTVTSSTVRHNVSVDDSGDVAVTNNTIDGNLRIAGTTGTCADTGNAVSGQFDGCP